MRPPPPPTTNAHTLPTVTNLLLREFLATTLLSMVKSLRTVPSRADPSGVYGGVFFCVNAQDYIVVLLYKYQFLFVFFI